MLPIILRCIVTEHKNTPKNWEKRQNYTEKAEGEKVLTKKQKNGNGKYFSY